MKTKTCTKCKETKPTSEFYKNRKSKDGLVYYCKMCACEYRRKYYEANKEKLKEDTRRRREANHKQECRRVQKRDKEANNRSLELAHKKYLPWEDWEIEFVMADNGLTDYQKAVKLGRTYYSIRTKRIESRKNLVTS